MAVLFQGVSVRTVSLLKYIGRRFVSAIPTLILITFLAFGLLFVTPGGPVEALAGIFGTTEQKERIREELGLNDPIHTQYLRWISGVFLRRLRRNDRDGARDADRRNAAKAAARHFLADIGRRPGCACRRARHRRAFRGQAETPGLTGFRGSSASAPTRSPTSGWRSSFSSSSALFFAIAGPLAARSTFRATSSFLCRASFCRPSPLAWPKQAWSPASPAANSSMCRTNHSSSSSASWAYPTGS